MRVQVVDDESCSDESQASDESAEWSEEKPRCQNGTRNVSRTFRSNKRCRSDSTQEDDGQQSLLKEEFFLNKVSLVKLIDYL
jgi:hypothetical protein